MDNVLTKKVGQMNVWQLVLSLVLVNIAVNIGLMAMMRLVK